MRSRAARREPTKASAAITTEVACDLIRAALLCAVVLCPVQAHEATGGNVRIVSAVDLGGTIQTGGNVQNTGFVGEPGIVASGGNVVARQGGNSGIFYPTNLTFTAASLTINEQGDADTNSTRTQLLGNLAFDDGTVGALDGAQVGWTPPSTNSALASISPAGIAQAATVYQHTPASFTGTYGGLSATSSLTVLNVLPDNFSVWAGDTFDDAWEIAQGMSTAVDPDATNNGVPNWQLYAMGFNPAQPAPATLSAATNTNGYFAVRYTRNPYATNYTFIPQETGNVSTGFTNMPGPVSVTNLQSGLEYITTRGNVLMNLTNRQFLRIKIIRPTP